MALAARQAALDERSLVITKAVLRAADRLGLNSASLGRIIGVSPPTISRMKRGDYFVSEDSKSFELATLVIRLFRSLDAITGGDDTVAKAWMRNHNTVLDACPADKILTITGLTDVIAYLDSRRAVL